MSCLGVPETCLPDEEMEKTGWLAVSLIILNQKSMACGHPFFGAELLIEWSLLGEKAFWFLIWWDGLYEKILHLRMEGLWKELLQLVLGPQLPGNS